MLLVDFHSIKRVSVAGWFHVLSCLTTTMSYNTMSNLTMPSHSHHICTYPYRLTELHVKSFFIFQTRMDCGEGKGRERREQEKSR